MLESKPRLIAASLVGALVSVRVLFPWVSAQLLKSLLSLLVVLLDSLELGHKILVVLLVAVEVPNLLTHPKRNRLLPRLVAVELLRDLLPSVDLLEILLLSQCFFLVHRLRCSISP